jgi:hypothetical protein
MFLAAQVSLFERVTQEDNAIVDKINFDDLSLSDVTSFVDYIHHGKLSNLDERCEKLFVMAKKFEMRKLEVRFSISFKLLNCYF